MEAQDQQGRSSVSTGAGFLARMAAMVPKRGIGLALIAMVAVFGMASPHFFTVRNFVNVANQTAIISIVAFGMTIVMLTGGIDLSVGAVVSLSAVICAKLLEAGFSPFLVVPLCLLPGLAIGALNSFFSIVWNIQPFLATLGMLSIARGISLILSGGQTTYIDNKQYLFMTGQGYIGPIPIMFLWTLLFFAITWMLMTKTTFGRRVRAVGGNSIAARQAGLKVEMIRTKTFLMSGALASFAGLLLAGRLSSGIPTVGNGMELDAIAASVLGGTGFKGEGGSIAGTFMGAIVMGTLINGLTILGVNTYVQEIAKGSVIILAIMFSQIRKRRGRA